MDYAYSNLVTQAKSWGATLIEQGWATDYSLQALMSYEEEQTSASLFAHEARPLVVAFLGGTGVGKSSLLNRLAGENIAKSGVVRPTSKEVTLFHHRDISLAEFPNDLPMDKIKIATHSQGEHQHIMWVDMPDFDSTEALNKQLVLGWLPHIDVLIYVVSPERYRDNKAWQLLQAEGEKHAWLFVFNQCDRGMPEQYDDFKQQLAIAGFDSPLIYQSCCVAEHSLDNFQALQSSLQALATDSTVQQLALRKTAVHKENLAQVLESSLKIVGDKQATDTLLNQWQPHFLAFKALLNEAMVLPLQQLSQQGAEIRELERLILEGRLWDSWSQLRFEDALEQLVQQANPSMPLKKATTLLASQATEIIKDKVESKEDLLAFSIAFSLFFLYTEYNFAAALIILAHWRY